MSNKNLLTIALFFKHDVYKKIFFDAPNFIPLNPASAFPAACGRVSERKKINNKRIEDSPLLAARSFNSQK